MSNDNILEVNLVDYTANDIVSLSAGRAFREKIGYSKYLIFDDGSVYSKVSHKNLKPIKKSTGYYAVNLYDDNGNRKMFFIHQLVAEAFLPNLNHYIDINHKDENKANNAVKNLEWCSKTYNENYGSKKEREIKTKTLNNCINGHKKIIQYDLNNNFIKEWNSLTEASNTLNISIGNISSVINEKRNQAGGYIWKAD